MNKKEMNAAIGEYAERAKEVTKEEMKEILLADEYKPADADKIIAGLYPAAAEEEDVADHYQEWEVKIAATKEGPKYEKLKVKRKCVKITDGEAETLNKGVLLGGNNYAVMYFKAGEE